MSSLSTYSSERSLTKTVDGVTYRGRWFVDNHVVILYVGSAGPLTKLVLGASPEVAANKIFHEYLAGESIRNRAKPFAESEGTDGTSPSSGANPKGD